MKRILMIAVIAALSCGAVSAQIYRVAQMNADQIRALDKQKTVVILTGGILEEHGPHLPSYTDGYSNEWLAQKLAESIVTRPGMSVLMFPTIRSVTAALMRLPENMFIRAVTRFAARPCAPSLWI